MSCRPFSWAASVVCLFVVACGGTQEPDPEVPAATASASASKPKREKPKCLAFTENCIATADTQAKIPGSEAVFIPPAGWTYAQQSDATLTQIEGSPAVIALAGFDAAPADEAKTRDSLYAALLEVVKLSPPEKFKKKYTPKWDKADQERANGDMKIKLWQAEAAKRSGKSGFLLVLMTTDPAGKKIVGVAFSPDGDDSSIEKISTALETIGPGSYQ